MKEFNVTGTCIPSMHYMVDTSQKLDQIIELIDRGRYFTINRARQYGKTTTFAALSRRLKTRYLVIRMSFEGMGEMAFRSDEAFVRNFVRKVARELEFHRQPESLLAAWQEFESYSEKDFEDAFDFLSQKITRLCRNSGQEIVLMIDEVDKSSDNQIFLNFLGMLRNKYLDQNEERDITFKSVILAGVYDIKNLKLKLHPDAERKYNSPWNIAADFTVDMSFSAEEIATMLREYEDDCHTGMDIEKISEELHFYTGGYPYLVSRLCKWIDEEGAREWTAENVRAAEKELLHTPCTLFDDVAKNYENNPGLREVIDNMLFDGKRYDYVMTDPVIGLGVMLGIFCRKAESVAISNIIFETLLYNHVMIRKDREGLVHVPERGQFVKCGRLDMVRVLEKFQELMHAEYRQADEGFVERQGRLLFLCFLKPIINGTGFYYVEPETRNSTRMDIVVAYGGEEFIIELKLWRGSKYRADGIRQLEAYMDSRRQEKGYLVSFSFLKKEQSACGWITQKESAKRIFEVII